MQKFQEKLKKTLLVTDPSLLELLKRKDVILSPHIAGWTQESNQRMATLLVQKITGKFKEDE